MALFHTRSDVSVNMKGQSSGGHHKVYSKKDRKKPTKPTIMLTTRGFGKSGLENFSDSPDAKHQ